MHHGVGADRLAVLQQVVLAVHRPGDGQDVRRGARLHRVSRHGLPRRERDLVEPAERGQGPGAHVRGPRGRQLVALRHQVPLPEALGRAFDVVQVRQPEEVAGLVGHRADRRERAGCASGAAALPSLDDVVVDHHRQAVDAVVGLVGADAPARQREAMRPDAVARRPVDQVALAPDLRIEDHDGGHVARGGIGELGEVDGGVGVRHQLVDQRGHPAAAEPLAQRAAGIERVAPRRPGWAGRRCR